MKIKDLTSGHILSHLFRLAMPTIGSSFMQMTYVLSDMIWLGRLGEDAVASVGAAGLFIWCGNSLLLTTKIGAEIGVSQSLGRKTPEIALQFLRLSLFWASIISLFFSVIVFIFASNLIAFFAIPSEIVAVEGSSYLRIVSLSFVFFFVNPTFAGIYNGMGNSRLPFRYISVGVILNVILDPLLIFGIGPIPAMGVKGAAYATVFAQVVVWSIFFYRLIVRQEMMKLQFKKFNFGAKISKKIFQLGFPVASESALFSIFAMILTKMTASFGAVAIAVQSIGAQIESVSWMTTNGFSTALCSFTGQNFGAGKWKRIKIGYRFAMTIGLGLGICVTMLFLFFGENIFSIFLKDADSIKLGGAYLKILAVSQLFMIFEITTRGSFNGIGKTIPPSLTGITFTGLRIPLAYLLCSIPELGVLGIWWAISLTSVVKGTLLPIWLLIVFRKKNSTSLKT
ncbi:MAG: MATE family efflux transporter [Marinilabiliaceae bacterium]|nr:MATE family efflux transporter [Marinilabiliaceae bacterium]